MRSGCGVQSSCCSNKYWRHTSLKDPRARCHMTPMCSLQPFSAWDFLFFVIGTLNLNPEPETLSPISLSYKAMTMAWQPSFVTSGQLGLHLVRFKCLGLRVSGLWSSVRIPDPFGSPPLLETSHVRFLGCVGGLKSERTWLMNILMSPGPNDICLPKQDGRGNEP